MKWRGIQQCTNLLVVLSRAAVGTDVLRACAGCVAAINRTRRAAIEIRGDAAALSNGSRLQRLGPEDEEKSVNQDPRLVAYRSFPPCNPAALALLYFVGALTEPPASARPDTNNPADKMTSAVEIVMKLLCIGSKASFGYRSDATLQLILILPAYSSLT